MIPDTSNIYLNEIIFISHGIPTYGEKNIVNIIANVSERNKAKKDFIFIDLQFLEIRMSHHGLIK